MSGFSRTPGFAARRDPELTRDGERRRRPPRTAPSRHACLRPSCVERPGRRRRNARPPSAGGRSARHPGQHRLAAAVAREARRRPGSRSRPRRSRAAPPARSTSSRRARRRGRPRDRAWISSPSPSGRVPQTKHSSKTGAPQPASARAASRPRRSVGGEVETRRGRRPAPRRRVRRRRAAARRSPSRVDGERPLERRWQPQRHLDAVPVARSTAPAPASSPRA